MRWGDDGRLYVAQAFGSQISSVNVEDGTASIVSAADGPIVAPDDLAFDSKGNLFVTEVMSARVSAIRPNGDVDVIANDMPVANGVTVHDDRIFMSEFNQEGRIVELFADGAAPRQIASGLMMPNALSLGPDGMLYFPLVPLGEVWRVSVEGGTPERVIGGLDIPTAVKFDAWGRLFVAESGTGAIMSIDAKDGTKTEFARVAYGIDNFAFAPDGRMFVSHFTDGEIIEIALDGSQRVAVSGGMTGPFGIAAGVDGNLLVADGMSLARIDGAGTISRPAMLLQHGFPGYVRGVAAGRGAEFIVTNSGGQCAQFTPGREAEILVDDLDQAMAVVSAGNGDVVICEAGAGRILSVDGDGRTRTLAAGLGRPMGVAEAPDGSFFVSDADAGTVVHINDGSMDVVMSGLIEPHGVTVWEGRVVVLDRGNGTLNLASETGQGRQIIASNLPCGTHGEMRPNILPGIKGLMPGPLLPLTDIATLSNGSIAVGGDEDGSILLVAADSFGRKDA